MAILSSIGLKFGLPITIDSNDRQNKLEVCISEITAKMAKKGPKMAALPLLAKLDGHNLVPLYPIWTFDHTKMISSSRRVEW